MLVLGIFGPTAAGKTAIAEELADRLDAELVSADAMQVYRGVPVLTNQSARRTALVAIRDLDQEMSVGEYQALAHQAIDEAIAAGRPVVVVGGTGLYLRAALSGLALPPAPPPERRARLDALYDELGADGAHDLLARRDPDAAARVHPNDRRRVVRALELAEMGESLAPRSDTLWADEYRHPTLVIGLDVSTHELHARIERRTETMVARGAGAEALAAASGSLSRTAASIHGLEDFATLPTGEAVERYNARVKRYAAYQRKWMRRIPGVVIIDANRPSSEVADEILEVAGARQRLPRGRAVRADG